MTGKQQLASWGVLITGVLLLLLSFLLNPRSDPAPRPRLIAPDLKEKATPATPPTPVRPDPAWTAAKSYIRVRVVDVDGRPIRAAKVLSLASREPIEPSKPDSFIPAMPDIITSVTSEGVTGDSLTSAEGSVLLTVDLSRGPGSVARVQVMANADGYASRTPGSVKLVRVPPPQETRDVELLLRRGRKLEGRVLNLQSPHDRADLSFIIETPGPEGEGQWYVYPKVSEDGSFQVAAAPDHDLEVRVKHYRGKYHPYQASVPKESSHVTIPLTVVPGYEDDPRLVIHVQAPPTLKQLNHHIVIYSAQDGTIAKRLPNSYDIETRATRVPAGTYTVYLVSADTTSSASYWARETVTLGRQAQAEVTMKLQRGNVLYFTLTDPQTQKPPASENFQVSVLTPIGSNPAAVVGEYAYRPRYPAMYVGGLEPGPSFVKIIDRDGVFEDIEVRPNSSEPESAPRSLLLRRKKG